MSQKIAHNVAILNIEGRRDAMHPVVIWDDQDVVLIDTGLPLQFEVISKALEEVGLSPSKVTHILFTHHDIDHIGTALEFIEASPGIKTLAHELEAPYINGEKTPLKLAALEANLADLSDDQKVFYNMLKSGYANRQIPISTRVVDHDCLSICGGIEVIFTSGHTIGHCCYYLLESKILVAGDSLNAENGSLLGPNPMFSYDINLAKESLKKLKDLDIHQIVAYHGGLVNQDIKTQLQKAME